MIQQKHLSTFFLILRYFVRKRKTFFYFGQDISLTISSRGGCSRFSTTIKWQLRWLLFQAWNQVQLVRGKARHSDAFRASLVRAHFSLQSSNRNCLVKSYLGQIKVIYVYLSIPHRISLFIHLFDYLSWLSNGIESVFDLNSWFTDKKKKLKPSRWNLGREVCAHRVKRGKVPIKKRFS